MSHNGLINIKSPYLPMRTAQPLDLMRDELARGRLYRKMHRFLHFVYGIRFSLDLCQLSGQSIYYTGSRGSPAFLLASFSRSRHGLSLLLTYTFDNEEYKSPHNLQC